jgi:Tfp pilus assembly protein PilV
MSNRCPTQRSGFALVEALIALVIIGVVFLGLEGSLTLVMRSLADSERQTTATRVAESQRERAFAAGCVAGSGSDSGNAVAVDWTASPAGSVVRVTQTVRYPQRSGARVERYTATGACP